MTLLLKVISEFPARIYGGGCTVTTPIYSGGSPRLAVFAVESRYLFEHLRSIEFHC